jgi:hypothetical protein
MKNRSKTAGLLLGLIIMVFSNLISGCVRDAPQPRVRVTNLGAEDILNLTILFPDEKIYIGNIPSGATSEYHIAPKGVYSYAAYQYQFHGQQVSQEVVDWMGESPMKGQLFTYKIDYDPSRGQMRQIKLVEVVRDE